MGAFVTAVQSGVPVVPIAIRGTRSMLRAGSWYPRRGRIALTIGEAIFPEPVSKEESGAEWRAAVKLRDATRSHILRYCGEPDLEESE